MTAEKNADTNKTELRMTSGSSYLHDRKFLYKSYFTVNVTFAIGRKWKSGFGAGTSRVAHAILLEDW